MEIWLIYRTFKNITTGKIDRIEPIEYCKSENEAAKYAKLFDLQRPVDLRDRISHKYIYTVLVEE
jgi:hypothetical protein